VVAEKVGAWAAAMEGVVAAAMAEGATGLGVPAVATVAAVVVGTVEDVEVAATGAEGMVAVD
jgi:hypothetical protein